MKKLFLYPYGLLRWLIIVLIFLSILLVFIIESPATVLELAQPLLKGQGITYGKMRGGLLSGFTLSDVNYNNQVQAKELTLKVDWDALENRRLVIENVVLDGAQLQREFLTSLIENNSSDENKSEGNFTLPFDTVEIKNADISILNTGYQNYYINEAKLHIDHFESDMKKEHKGRVDLSLDSNMTKATIHAKILNEQYDIVANIEGEHRFIEQFTAEQNLTFLSNPKLRLTAKGNLEKVKYNLEVNRLSLKQNAYRVETKALKSFGSYSIKENRVVNTLKTELDGNVAFLKLDAVSRVDIDDINRTLVFDINGLLKPKKEFIPAELAKQHIRIDALPSIKLWAKGDMKKVKFSTLIKGLRAKQNDISLDLKDLELKGSAKPLHGDVDLRLLSHLDSSVSKALIKTKAKLNYKDINNSLNFDTSIDLKLHSHYVNRLLEESNVTFYGDTPIVLKAKGSMKKLQFSALLKGLRGKQNDIKFHLPLLDIKGDTQALNGKTSVKLLTKVNSSVANGQLWAKSRFNFNDINNSLSFTSKGAFDAHASYLNPLLKEAELELRGESHLDVEARGDLKELKSKFALNTTFVKDKIVSKAGLKTSEIVLNLKEHRIKGALTLESRAKNIALNLKSQFSGDYTQPKKLQSSSKLLLKRFNAFGVNLSSLLPLELNAQSGTQGIVAQLESKKIHLDLKSEDLDHLRFKLKSDKIYPAKIVEVPSELKGKFIALDLAGEATLSQQYASIKGAFHSNKNFKATVDVENNAKGLEAKIASQHLNLTARGDIKSKKIDAELNIDSVTKLQEEFNKLYTFKITPIDGAVKLNAKVRGEAISAQVRSPKLQFEAFNIENIDIDADYKKELLTLHKLSFNTTGFPDNKLNKKFYLNKKATIHLGERRDVSLDMHPNIKVDMKGTAQSLEGNILIRMLPLGYPEYGSTTLSTQIHYSQKGEKKKIVGGVALENLIINYESKFLDTTHDPDVIVLTKKDKKKKKQRDSFLEDTFIDLAIFAPDAKYETKDIKLKLTVNVKASKKFGKDLGMLGKIKEINGEVIQAPKLFNIVDSNVVFRGNKEINPLLDIVVEYELPDVLITIFVHGDANRPKLEFSSDPVMPKKDILSYLLLGVSTASLKEGKGSLEREAQLFIMNQAARDFAYDLDLDRVLIKDDGTGEGYAIQVGKKVNDKTMAIIETSKVGNSYILEYEVNRNIKVEVGQHQKIVPSQSIDIFFRKKFK